MTDQTQARFLTGSTMRHVTVMTMTSMVGLSFMFLVDAATIFWVSKLNEERLITALGFAWTIQFLMISVNIGFMIAATALVAKSIGEGKRQNAREQAAAALMIGLGLQAIVSFLILYFRREFLELAGASGDVLEIASRFLLISVPSMLMITVGMITSAILRAEGDAKRSMYVTLSAGVVAMIVDPILILWMELGIEGAAWGVVISRAASAVLGLYCVIKIHDLLAPLRATYIHLWAKPFFIIVGPATLTQLSTPFGNYLITRLMSEFGDSAVAGWALLGRLAILMFGGVYALSGSIGGIIGQNFGAGQFDRIRTAYRDALIFCTLYVIVAWAILAAATGPIIWIFNLSSGAADVIRAFAYIAAVGYIFAGALYVSNASFNNLGRPIYSTGFNWVKDGLLIWPICVMMGGYFAAPGVVYGQSLAWLIAGLLSTVIGWRFINNVEIRQTQSAGQPEKSG